ncbi:sugar transferase, partial [Candidatus Azambacteria bacterium]|nr:sugar transferase [Candidatus Azambacteria bacterium]
DSISGLLADEMKQKPGFGYEVVQKVSNIDLNYIQKIIEEKKIETVVVGQSDYPADAMVALAELCQLSRINFKFAPTIFQALATNINIDTLSGVPLMEVKYTSLDGWGKITKRAMDIFGSIFGIIFLSPFFIIIAILIKLDSRGPVFVRLKRVTQGREFDLYKFRSMIENAEEMKKELIFQNERKDGPLFKIKDDPRITIVGRFIRRTRIDEFPQLFNVLRGEMSLVGPRPHQPDEIERYEKHHKKVLMIKSGMTGMAQVSGSSDLPFDEEVKLDVYYIENWSLFLDLKILLRTFIVLFKDKSAC